MSRLFQRVAHYVVIAIRNSIVQFAPQAHSLNNEANFAFFGSSRILALTWLPCLLKNSASSQARFEFQLESWMALCGCQLIDWHVSTIREWITATIHIGVLLNRAIGDKGSFQIEANILEFEEERAECE